MRSTPRTSTGRTGHHWLLLAGAVLLLTGYFVLSAWYSYKEIKRENIERLLHQVWIVDLNVGHQLKAAAEALRELQRQIPGWQSHPFGLEQVTAAMKSAVKMLPGVRVILLTDANGIMIATSGEHIPRNFDFSGRDYFKETKANPNSDKLSLFPPFYALTGPLVMPLSVPVLDRDGKFNGVLAAFPAAEFFGTLLESVRFHEHTHVMLSHGDGKLFIMRPEREDLAGSNQAVPGSFFARHMETGQQESVLEGVGAVTKQKRIVAARTINPSELNLSRPLYVSVSHDPDVIFEAWKRDTIRNGIVFVLFTIGIFFLLFLYQRSKSQAQAEKVSMKDRFLAAMSHELRTPLSNIIGFAQLMGNAPDRLTPEKRVEYTSEILASSEHLLSLVNDILDMSQIEAGKRKLSLAALDARKAWDFPLSTIAFEAKQESLSIRHEFPAGPVSVLADERAMNQCLINLLANAVKFTSKGGTITCRVEARNGKVAFTVEDTGKGIASEHLPRLGQPFEQVGDVYRAETKGTGLGLAITSKLVELMSGTLAIESELGKGTRVTIALPTAASVH